jgi:hypothetical protein
MRERSTYSAMRLRFGSVPSTRNLRKFVQRSDMVTKRKLRLGAPELVGRNIDLAETVAFLACVRHRFRPTVRGIPQSRVNAAAADPSCAFCPAAETVEFLLLWTLATIVAPIVNRRLRAESEKQR